MNMFVRVSTKQSIIAFVRVSTKQSIIAFVSVYQASLSISSKSYLTELSAK